MKTFFRNLLLLSTTAVMLWGCEKEETRAVATDGKAATLTASATTLVLTKPNASNTAVTFTATKADFGFQAAVAYTLQLAVKGTNFASPKEIALDAKALSKTYTVIDLNALFLSMGLPTSVNSNVEARVKSTISATAAPVYSNVIGMVVNPYPLISFIYVPGDYQGWNPSTADSLISPTSNGIYEGIIRYPTGGSFEFKITPAKNWNVAYGDAGTGKISTTAGGNLKVPGAGTYKLVADLNANTFVATPHSWSIIGDATAGGWGADTDMRYHNGRQQWELTTVLIGGKELKFRLNKDWGTNYGGSGGVLANGGANIPVPSNGTYLITFSLATNSYTLTKQ